MVNSSNDYDPLSGKEGGYFLGGAFVLRGGEDPKVMFTHRENQIGDVADITVVEKYVRNMIADGVEAKRKELGTEHHRQ